MVWTAHDVLPFVRTPKDRARFAAIYRGVDRVIVHGRNAAAELFELSGVRAAVIEHPAPRRLTHLTKADARAHLQLPPDERVLLAPGFVRAYKGYDLLAEVWERLGDSAPLLVVMGELLEDGERPVVERLSRAARTRVHLGYASDEDLEAAAVAADAILLPYREASDSGLVHLARSLGTPVIASNAPQLAESVTSTGAGIALPRDVETWSAALAGDLPPVPPAPPALAAAGRAHVEVYERSIGTRLGRAPQPAVQAGRRRHVAVYTDARELGGAEVSLRTLLGALGDQIDLVVVGVDRDVIEFVTAARKDVPTVLLEPVRNKYDVVRIRAHVKLMRELKPDVFHANLNTPWSCQYGILAAALARGTRIVAVEHAPLPAANARQRRLRRLLSGRVDVHVAVAEETARTIEEFSGLPASSLRVVHTGVPDDPRRPVERPFSGPTVGAIGRLVSLKGYDVLLRALAELPGVAALLVGEGPERNALERLAKELGVSDRVALLGWQDDARRWLGAMDVFVAPSRVEGFGLGIVEAMLAEVPVVASGVGGMGETIIDEETGLLVSPDDHVALAAAVDRLLSDESERRRLTHLARALAMTEFTPEIMAGRFEAIYREVAP